MRACVRACVCVRACARASVLHARPSVRLLFGGSMTVVKALARFYRCAGSSESAAGSSHL